MSQVMKHIILLMLTILPFLGYSNSTFSEGIEAFNNENYSLSADKFDSVISISPTNISAYFNYGYAKMKIRNYGDAIWGFEKVLEIEPSDIEAKEKIQEAYFELNSNDNWEYRLNRFQSSMYSVSADTWGIIAILCSIIFAFSLITFVRRKSHSTRRIMLLTGAVSSIALIFSLFIGSLTKSHSQSNDLAVITNKNSMSIHEKIHIPEGSLVEILGKDNDEVRILSTDGEPMSVKEEDLRVI